ncbi:Mannosyltransferase OCH1 and related enzymes [Mannheimia haemolytica]|uniref:Mannosyltransferase OCH1 and related enzymes n=1 Tax=Mannheimia haemolytica TaxID=75985 RepID=A0A448T873_MANHA|nr:glycosyltransferase [Mannheimia haemolytica]VEI76174.1 Mannosyltransferase OCH1 and related enzymes [Mannheimia haemolytica]
MAVKNEQFIVICNGVFRLLGNIVKILSYPFHALFPKKRFTIPEYSPAKIKSNTPSKITKTIWQTNYSNKVTLPMYANYLFNRLMSLSYDYRYVSTEEREAYIKANADERTFSAYSKLTDGAAQADFWRIFTLLREGGIYIDIDGHLVYPLSQIIGENDSEVLIKRRDKYTNFFLASEKGNWILKDTLELIISNIENRRIEGGVFVMTGPDTLNNAIGDKEVNFRRDKVTCAQGTFTNEYFQYIDKPGSKWNYKKNEDLLK